MQRAALAFAAALVGLGIPATSASLTAQTYWTAPAGYENRPSEWFSGFLGNFMNGRMQLVDRSVNGLSAAFVKVDYRTARFVRYSDFQGMGRRWTRTTISAGPCSFRSITTDYAKNYKSAGTQVFTGTLTLPTLTGAQRQTWGKPLSIVFSKPFVKKKGDDFLLDFQTYGGTLNNGFVPRSGVAEYFLDGTRVGTAAYDIGSYVPAISTCNDSAHTHTFGARLYSYVYNYGSNNPTPALRDRMQVSYSSLYTAPNQAPVIHVASIGGSDRGFLAPGFGCNRLHVNPATVVGYVIGKTSTSSTGFFGGQLLIPFADAWAAAPIYLQAVWTDSKTGQPMLSQARKWRIPAKPRDNGKMAVYGYNRPSGLSRKPFRHFPITGPVVRFSNKK